MTPSDHFTNIATLGPPIIDNKLVVGTLNERAGKSEFLIL